MNRPNQRRCAARTFAVDAIAIPPHLCKFFGPAQPLGRSDSRQIIGMVAGGYKCDRACRLEDSALVLLHISPMRKYPRGLQRRRVREARVIIVRHMTF